LLFSVQVVRFVINLVLKFKFPPRWDKVNLLKPTGYVMHQQFNIQQVYALPTLQLCDCIYLRTNSEL